MYGHTLGRSIGLGYVRNDAGPASAEWIAAGSYELEVATERFPAAVSLRPPYDPRNDRIRS
jgi:4-methylaminobutanoate oxidase (formaldehyde-forming)